MQLSNTAFWDVDMAKMDEDQHADFIIARVFQYGLMSDIKAVIKHYDAQTINQALKNYRGLNRQTVNFAKVLGYL
ncbi:hypothetical protein FW774_04265 (plasmid) [Pedobacter sp. BS3]|uniref:DUF6922 domain-containing protein n=1 Tax=Pedobacter sp. BS3 TaxID=2567937 RepID=UPI0011EF39D9|nr:hypothetical protein [Pedobacter sp. BS3]TZF86269.1 hypothetical protein FW774_04265 [Pedobacter sp. BS3]